MSIVDCQNYPKKGEKVKICENCRFYVKKKVGRTVRGYSGYCVSNAMPEVSTFGYGDRGSDPMEVMSNGFCREYKEKKDDA